MRLGGTDRGGMGRLSVGSLLMACGLLLPACPDDPADPDEEEACPGVTNPECTTSNACGNNEICAQCECVPAPDECEVNSNSDCVSDDDCESTQSCVGCLCVGGCEEEDECQEDGDCGDGETCEVEEGAGCSCVGSGDGDGDDTGTGGTGDGDGDGCSAGSECTDDDDCETGSSCVDCQCVEDDPGGSGECATGVVTDGPITVTGTSVEVDVDPDNCGTICTISIENAHTADVFTTYFPFSLADPIQLDPHGFTIPSMTSAMVDVVVNNCASGMEDSFDVQFFDDPGGVSFGPIAVSVKTTAP